MLHHFYLPQIKCLPSRRMNGKPKQSFHNDTSVLNPCLSKSCRNYIRQEVTISSGWEVISIFCLFHSLIYHFYFLCNCCYHYAFHKTCIHKWYLAKRHLFATSNQKRTVCSSLFTIIYFIIFHQSFFSTSWQVYNQTPYTVHCHLHQRKHTTIVENFDDVCYSQKPQHWFQPSQSCNNSPILQNNNNNERPTKYVHMY